MNFLNLGLNMIGPNCPIIERDEKSVIKNKDIVFINTNHKKEFEFWCHEKDD